MSPLEKTRFLFNCEMGANVFKYSLIFLNMAIEKMLQQFDNAQCVEGFLLTQKVLYNGGYTAVYDAYKSGCFASREEIRTQLYKAGCYRQ